MYEISAIPIHACLFDRWPREASYLHDNRSSDDMIHGPIVEHILDIQVKVLLVRADCPHQLSDVVGIQSAGLGWQTAGQVCIANMGHPLKKILKSFSNVTLNWRPGVRPVTDDVQ